MRCSSSKCDGVSKAKPSLRIWFKANVDNMQDSQSVLALWRWDTPKGIFRRLLQNQKCCQEPFTSPNPSLDKWIPTTTSKVHTLLSLLTIYSIPRFFWESQHSTKQEFI